MLELLRSQPGWAFIPVPIREQPLVQLVKNYHENLDNALAFAKAGTVVHLSRQVSCLLSVLYCWILYHAKGGNAIPPLFENRGLLANYL